jgi:hypothetical protein
MKFMLFVLPTVPGTLEDRKRLRPIGRNNERYQQMLDELRKLAVFADDAGFDVLATTEHHFHSEGYETSVAPLLIYADLAARTKRIKFSPLGLVLPSWDPIRAAEELAVLDHLTKGRIYAGFARGYQDRWVTVLARSIHERSTRGPHGDAGGRGMGPLITTVGRFGILVEKFPFGWAAASLCWQGTDHPAPSPVPPRHRAIHRRRLRNSCGPVRRSLERANPGPDGGHDGLQRDWSG